ncbi:MAG: TonB-dependent receptor [Bacteroidales bacterium]|nr:TonB-dependent receptor [Bacteroidales bacterium]
MEYFITFFYRLFLYPYRQKKTFPILFLKFTDVPKHKVIGYAKIEKAGLFYAMVEVEYNSDRYSTSDGKFTAPPYTLFNLNAEYYTLKYVSIKAGIHNIFDKLYYVTEGYPEEGRTVYLSLTYKFSK